MKRILCLISVVLLLLAVSCNFKEEAQKGEGQIAPEGIDVAPKTSDQNDISFDEDNEEIITLSYDDQEGDRATLCKIDTLENLIISKDCSCDDSGICTVGIVGLQDYNGDASFLYTVTANEKESNESKVSMTINPVNDAPVAGEDIYLPIGTGLGMSFNVLSNDTDVDGDELFIVNQLYEKSCAVVDPCAWIEAGVGNNTLVFQSVNGYVGDFSDNYKISDGLIDVVVEFAITVE